jgi:hypothetical protein
MSICFRLALSATGVDFETKAKASAPMIWRNWWISRSSTSRSIMCPPFRRSALLSCGTICTFRSPPLFAIEHQFGLAGLPPVLPRRPARGVRSGSQIGECDHLLFMAAPRRGRLSCRNTGVSPEGRDDNRHLHIRGSTQGGRVADRASAVPGVTGDWANRHRRSALLPRPRGLGNHNRIRRRLTKPGHYRPSEAKLLVRSA